MKTRLLAGLWIAAAAALSGCSTFIADLNREGDRPASAPYNSPPSSSSPQESSSSPSFPPDEHGTSTPNATAPTQSGGQPPPAIRAH